MEKFKKTLIQTGLLRKFIPYTPNYTNSKPMWRIYLQFLRFYPSRKAQQSKICAAYSVSHTAKFRLTKQPQPRKYRQI